jgi:ribokinase
MKKIVVVGSINIDIVFNTVRIPLTGETVSGKDYYTSPGGKGANQALAAHRMGAQVQLIGKVGRDAFAPQALAELEAAGMDLSSVSAAEAAATGVAAIIVDEQGNNVIVVAPGANHAFTFADVMAQEQVLAQADALLMQFEVPMPLVQQTAAYVHNAGGKVVLNPAPATALPEGLLANVDVLIPNEHELALLAGVSGEDLSSLEAGARRLQQQGAGVIIVTLGEKGALLVEPGKAAVLVPSFSVSAVDTVAAGDAFVAGFTTAWLEGRALADAVQWGNAAGALAATHAGAQVSLPVRQQVEALLALSPVHP